MSRVGQLPPKQGLGDEEVAKFVVLHDFRNAQNRKDCGARGEGQKPHDGHRQRTPSSKPGKPLLRPLKPARAKARIIVGYDHSDECQEDLNNRNHTERNRRNRTSSSSGFADQTRSQIAACRSSRARLLFDPPPRTGMLSYAPRGGPADRPIRLDIGYNPRRRTHLDRGSRRERWRRFW